MAELVGVFGTSHSPVLLADRDDWPNLEPKTDLPVLDALVGQVRSRWPEHEARYRAATSELRQRLLAVEPDVLIIVGSDQRENFGAAGAPVFDVFLGPTLASSAGNRRTEGVDTHPVANPVPVSFGREVVEGLCDLGFDISHSTTPIHPYGIGHAVSWPLRFLDLPGDLPVLPVITNVWDPPNVPRVARCAALGHALRRVVEAASAPHRVAVLASGGLSHLVLDEELDARVLEALRSCDVDRWASVSDDELRLAHELHGLPIELNGTAEITDWVIADACANTGADIIDYVPAYRTETGIGVGMCFASWPVDADQTHRTDDGDARDRDV